MTCSPTVSQAVPTIVVLNNGASPAVPEEHHCIDCQSSSCLCFDDCNKADIVSLVFCFICILMVIGAVLFSVCYYSRAGFIVCVVFAVVSTILTIIACICSECKSQDDEQVQSDIRRSQQARRMFEPTTRTEN